MEEKANIDADLSYRLGLFFGFREDYWLDLQKHYELECWKDKLEKQVKKKFNLTELTLMLKKFKSQEIEDLANRYLSSNYPLSINKLTPRKIISSPSPKPKWIKELSK